MSLIAKFGVAIAALLVAAVLIVVAGVSGLLFQIWPTSFPDRPVSVSPQMVAELRSFASEPKFLPDDASFYPGAQSNPTRAEAEVALNGYIAELATELPQNARRSFVLGRMKLLLNSATSWDTEDQEQLGRYLNRVLEITQLKGSGELINVWRYGFPYGWL